MALTMRPTGLGHGVYKGSILQRVERCGCPRTAHGWLLYGLYLPTAFAIKDMQLRKRA
jgi:hypothetical protein